MREYELLGLQFNEYPLKEGLEAFKELMKKPGLHLTSCLSPSEILKIADNKEYRELFDKLEFVLSPGDHDALKKENNNRSEEFLLALFRSFMAAKDGIYLLCDTREHLDTLKSVLEKYSTVTGNRFNIVGEDIYDEVDKEAIYNRINVQCPKLIFSTMSFEMQRYVMMEGRYLLNASAWLGLIPSVIENMQQGRKIWHSSFFGQLEYKRALEKAEKKHRK